MHAQHPLSRVSSSAAAASLARGRIVTRTSSRALSQLVRMFKASTIYAAYGKQQPSQQSQDARGGQQRHASNNTSQPGKLNSSSSSRDEGEQLQQQHPNSSQQQQASQPSSSQQHQQQRGLRTSISSNNKVATAPLIPVTTNGMMMLPSSTHQQPAGFSLEPRTWVQLAADVTDGLLDTKYKSLAVYAEVKLAEALDRAAQACPNSIAGAAPEDCEDGQPLPNPLGTAVCCQLLGELADMSGPLQPTLLKLREALLPSIYSNCSGPSTCGPRPLQFEMLPWFALAGRLRRQNNQLLEQQAAFSRELAQHQEHMAHVEQQLTGLQAALEAGTASAAALEATNATLVAERLAAVAEAASASDELKKLLSEVTRLTADLDNAREQLSVVKEEYGNEQEQWKAQVDVYLQKLHVEATERATAMALASTEQQELEQKLWEVERKLEETEQQLQELSSKPQEQQQQPEQQQDAQQLLLTPRPSDWGPDRELAAACQSTAEAVRQLQQRHASETAALHRQLQLLSAFVSPDPAPQPWQLNLRTEASRYFLTELEVEPTDAQLLLPDDSGGGYADDGSAAAAADDNTASTGLRGILSSSSSSNRQQRQQAGPKLYASGLGLGADVPRFLRWDQPVELHDISTMQQLEQQVCEIWRDKAAFEAAHGSPCHLQAFLHHQFWSKAQQQQAGQAPPPQPSHSPDAGASEAACAEASLAGGTAIVSSSTTAVCVASSSSSSADTANNISSIAAAAASAGYQLYYACCTHRHDSVAVETVWQVLTGQRSEAVLLQEQQQQLQGLITVLQGLHVEAAAADGGSDEAAGQGSGGVAWGDVLSAVQAACPSLAKRPQQLHDLTGWLARACGVSAAASNLSSSSGTERQVAVVVVQAAALESVCAGLGHELLRRFGGTTGGGQDGAGDVRLPHQAAVPATAAVRQLAEGVLRQQLEA